MAFYGSLGEVNFDNLDASIVDTATDIFVYDTRKDSDGGAWRNRTQHTSWYNETLNTATRGSRREFPAVAVIVREAGFLKIYDGDDPDLPMWMVFEANNNGDTSYLLEYFTTGGTSVTALNGIITSGHNSNGATTINFINEKSVRYRVTGASGTYDILETIADRNTLASITFEPYSSTIGLVNSAVNDVAMTVLPNAPIDDATGLPIPTIAVATDRGVSIIKDDDVVVDLEHDGGTHETCRNVAFSEDNTKVLFESDVNDDNTFRRRVIVEDIPAGDTTFTVIQNDSYQTTTGGYDNGRPRILGGNTSSTGINEVLPQAIASGEGITFLDNELDDILSSRVAYATTSYNTGWMHGAIKGAFLSDTDTTDKTNGQTDPDRSVNNNSLTVYGTITKSAVATGAELVAYSNWSTSNYLEQPYNSDLNFGTSDFCIMCWVKVTSYSNIQVLLSQWNGTDDTGNRFAMYILATTGNFSFYQQNGASTTNTNNGPVIPQNVWTHLTMIRKSTGISFFVNGEETFISATSRDLSHSSNILNVGIDYNYASPSSNTSMSLLRLSASAPSAEQIKKIYEDEKFLFQENAACTLYGSSDAVTALAYDEVTERLHVGTSSGRSEFQGLRRINNTTTAVTTAISAYDSFVVEQ